MKKAAKLLKQWKSTVQSLYKTGADFSDYGFINRVDLPIAEKIFMVPIIFIGNMRFHAGVRLNIIRCYEDGFSFWNGSLDEDQEWYCEYKNITGFKKPLNTKFVNSLILIDSGFNQIECMVGNASKYIEEKEKANN